ncbi:hypothetical protein [Saccharothrix stipae]
MNTDELRDRLHDLPTPAALAPSPDLADDVLTAVRRRRRTGRIAVGTAAVVALGLGAPYLLRSDPAVPQQQAAASSSITITTGTVPPATTARLVPGPTSSPGTFPFTPGRPHNYTLGVQGFGSKLHSTSNAAHVPSGPDVHVTADPTMPTDGPVIDKTTTTVRGMPAEVIRMASKVKVVWQEQPGQWVVVESPTLAEAEVLRYAQDLRPEPQPIPMPLNFAWLPAGMSVVVTSDGATDETVVFAPTSDDGTKTITISRTGNEVGKVGTPIRVGDRTGLLSTMNSVTTLWVPLPGHGNLSVSVPDAVGLTQEDLVRFTEGITNN